MGDERFRANQLYAQSQSLRVLLACATLLVAFGDYGLLQLPLPLTLAGLATGMAGFYTTLLFYLEWKDDM